MNRSIFLLVAFLFSSAFASAYDFTEEARRTNETLGEEIAALKTELAKTDPRKPCPEHKINRLGYLAWHSWAEEQTRKGLKQTRCPKCNLYLFPSEI